MKKYNPKTFKPSGAFVGMLMADYAAAPGMNASSLKLILESPLTYKRKRDGLIVSEPSGAMQLGTALHSAILEGKMDYHTRPETYGDGKKWNANATECRTWIDEHSDKPILSATDAAFVAEAFSYVREHPKVAGNKLLSGGKPEVSVFAEIGGRLFKGRFDYYKPGCIVDLKSVADASGRGFFNAAMRYGWLLQSYLYAALATAIDGKMPDFYWLALQKGEMPLLNVRKLGPSAALLGAEAFDRAMSLLTACESSGVWPEFADDTTDEIKSLEVPDWALTANTEPEELTIGSNTIVV